MEHKGDLVSGSIGKKELSFSAPIILTNLIQAIYGLVDMVTIGHFVGACAGAQIKQPGVTIQQAFTLNTQC